MTSQLTWRDTHALTCLHAVSSADRPRSACSITSLAASSAGETHFSLIFSRATLVCVPAHTHTLSHTHTHSQAHISPLACLGFLPISPQCYVTHPESFLHKYFYFCAMSYSSREKPALPACPQLCVLWLRTSFLRDNEHAETVEHAMDLQRV